MVEAFPLRVVGVLKNRFCFDFDFCLGVSSCSDACCFCFCCSWSLRFRVGSFFCFDLYDRGLSTPQTACSIPRIPVSRVEAPCSRMRSNMAASFFGSPFCCGLYRLERSQFIRLSFYFAMALVGTLSWKQTNLSYECS